MGRIVRENKKVAVLSGLAGALLALVVMSIGASPAYPLDASDIDGGWLLVELRINGQAQTLPDCEMWYDFSSVGGTVHKYLVLDGIHPAEGDDTTSAEYRGPTEWTSTDEDEMVAAGLDPNEQSGLLQMDLGGGVQARLAYRIEDLGGGHERAHLKCIYQSSTWTVPAATIYAPRPAGYPQGQIMYQSPAGSRTLNSAILER